MAFEGMATPLGVKPGPRARGIPPRWRMGLVVLFGVIVSVLVVSSLLRGKSAPAPQAIAVIERADAVPPPAAAAPKADTPRAEGSARIERQTSSSGGLIIKVPDENPTQAVTRYDSRVAERSPQGILPAVGAGGHRPREIYARPFTPNGQPMLAIVMTGVGVSARGTEAAIRTLPGEVTLAFAPYGRNLDTQVAQARSDGHEILLQVPMEPNDFPASDPGPHTLRAGVDKDGNMERLRWLMSRFSGYVGLTNYMGSRLMLDQAAYGPLLEEINRRGLLFLEDGSTSGALTGTLATKAGLPSAVADRVAETSGRESLEAILDEAVRVAKARGKASVMIPALPANITRVAAFARTAGSRGVALAPISAIMSRNAP